MKSSFKFHGIIISTKTAWVVDDGWMEWMSLPLTHLTQLSVENTTNAPKWTISICKIQKFSVYASQTTVSAEGNSSTDRGQALLLYYGYCIKLLLTTLTTGDYACMMQQNATSSRFVSSWRHGLTNRGCSIFHTIGFSKSKLRIDEMTCNPVRLYTTLPIGGRIKRCSPSVYLSVCPLILCLRFSRNRKAVETSNLLQCESKNPPAVFYIFFQTVGNF